MKPLAAKVVREQQGVGPAPDLESRLAAWFRTTAGRRLAAAERSRLADAVRLFHGDAMLWLGPAPELAEVASRCMVRLALQGVGPTRAPFAAPSRFASGVVADPMELPLSSGSLDGVVLHHVLDCAADPRAVVREATRVLRPGGRLLVAGFNPFSLWALARLRPALRGFGSVGTWRLCEWLAVLGLAPSAPVGYVFYRGALPLALDGARWRRLGAWLDRCQAPLGGAYLLVATKVGYGTIVDQRRRRRAERALGGALPSPARRVSPAHRRAA